MSAPDRVVSAEATDSSRPPDADRGEPARPGKGLGQDLAITAATQVAVGVGGLLLYRLLATKKGAEGVAFYSLIKQFVTFAWPLVMLGFQTAIPRYVALVRDRAGAAEAYLVAAFALTGAASVAICAAALASPEATAELVFGDSDRDELVVPLVATLAATIALEVTAGWFRGQSNFRISNAVRVIAVAIFPVVLLVFVGGRSIGSLISLMALGVLAACVVVMIAPGLRAVRAFSASATGAAGRTLLNYGTRRIPGEFAAVLLFSVPPVLAAQFADLDGVAYISAGIYVLALVSIAFQPIGLVFLPVLSRLCATDFDAARHYVRQLATAAIHIALFITPQIVLFGDDVVRAWLGPSFDEAGTIIAITVFPAGFYIFNVVLRSALDAAAVTAYNARNNLISLAVATICVTAALSADVAEPLNAIAWSYSIGVTCYGLLTLIVVHRIFRLQFADYSLWVSLALAVLAAAVALPLELVVIEDDASAASIALLGVVEVALVAIYVMGLIRAGVLWPATIRDRLRARS